jgi:hypothetical protein
MKTDTSYIDIEDWKSQVFTKADLQNPQKLIEFITKQSINNVLSKK